MVFYSYIFHNPRPGVSSFPRCLIGGQTARSCPSSFRLAGSRGEIRGPSACWDDGVWEIEIERQIPSIWAKSTPQKKNMGRVTDLYILKSFYKRKLGDW